MNPKVTLVNHLPNPVETLAVLWEASKNEGPLLSIADVAKSGWKSGEGLSAEELFWRVLDQRIPVGESLTFVFMLEGVSVSFREQMVRHRIGTKVGQNVSVDTVPDLADSSFWSQSMRIQDMGKFADAQMYRIPETLKGKTVAVPPSLRGNAVGEVPTSARSLFDATMMVVQESYNALVAAGVPMEDARELIPLGAQHRISWTINLQSLLHVLGKRGCWVLQLGIWSPIIRGMISELATKVHPAFAKLLRPPCVGNDGKFKACTFRLEIQRRLSGDDKLPPCPLYLCRDADGYARLRKAHLANPESNGQQPTDALGQNPTPEQAQHAKSILLHERDANIVPMQKEMNERAPGYLDIWQFDPYTGP